MTKAQQQYAFFTLNLSYQGQLTHRGHDMTRQHVTQPVFSIGIQLNGPVHTYAA